MLKNSSDMPLQTSESCTIPQNQLIDDILKKYNAIVVTEPHRSYFSNDFTLSKKSVKYTKQEPIPEKTKLSGMISEIINQEACRQLRTIYKTIKDQKPKTRFEPSKITKPSIFNDPKTFQKALDGMSKVRQNYRKAYLSKLNDKSLELGQQAKPIESKYCANNYLYSQISVSGLASRKFNSVKAHRRVQMIPTITTDAKGYPVSPRQNNSQSIEKPRSQTKHRTKRYSTESEYEDTFVLDNVTPLDQFLSNFAKLKRKKKKIYRTRMEDIDSITRLAHEEGIENIDFYESVIIKAKKRRNTQI